MLLAFASVQRLPDIGLRHECHGSSLLNYLWDLWNQYRITCLDYSSGAEKFPVTKLVEASCHTVGHDWLQLVTSDRKGLIPHAGLTNIWCNGKVQSARCIFEENCRFTQARNVSWSHLWITAGSKITLGFSLFVKVWKKTCEGEK